jgi:hypothetical protein
MVSQRHYLLNKFLIACIFISVIMVLIKEKEGFASHYYNIDKLYRGPILDKLENTTARQMYQKSIPKIDGKSIRVGKYSKIDSNFGIHPCNDKNTKGNKICENFYKANDVVIGPKEKACMPGYDCRRVGFYCSLID